MIRTESGRVHDRVLRARKAEVVDSPPEQPEGSPLGSLLGVGAAAVWAPVRGAHRAFEASAQAAIKGLGIDQMEEGIAKDLCEGAFKAAPYLAAAGWTSLVVSAGVAPLTTAALVGAGIYAAGPAASGLLAGPLAAGKGAADGVKFVWDKLGSEDSGLAGRALQIAGTVLSAPLSLPLGAIVGVQEFVKGVVAEAYDSEDYGRLANVFQIGSLGSTTARILFEGASAGNFALWPIGAGASATVLGALPSLWSGLKEGADEAYQWGQRQGG